MNRTPVAFNSRGYMSRILEDLLSYGWRLDRIPEGGLVPRDGMKLVLKVEDKELRLRIFAYKVTSSGRSRPHERRVEITTTYPGGLRRERRYRDVVLGVEISSNKYVGIDAKRLGIGGQTHNASSFFDLEGLSARKGELLVNPRPVSHSQFTGGIELHAFFDGSRLAEYLFNQTEVHGGTYGFGGQFKTPARPRDGAAALRRGSSAVGEAFVLSSRIGRRRIVVKKGLLTAIEDRDLERVRGRAVTPEELKRVLQLCDEIGALGEQAVLTMERQRLRALGFNEQAAKVERVSLRSIGEGYDILSFEDDGVTKRYLEVKTTTGASNVVDVSTTEWRAAKRLGRAYYLVRVTRVRGARQVFFVRDPTDLERRGLVSKTASGWRVNLRQVIPTTVQRDRDLLP